MVGKEKKSQWFPIQYDRLPNFVMAEGYYDTLLKIASSMTCQDFRTKNNVNMKTGCVQEEVKTVLGCRYYYEGFDEWVKGKSAKYNQ